MLEKPLINKLINRGLSLQFVRRLFIIINLFIIISIFFILLPTWSALICLFWAVVAFSGIDIDIEPPKEPEWRTGLDGYGLYRNDVRIDGGSIEDEE